MKHCFNNEKIYICVEILESDMEPGEIMVNLFDDKVVKIIKFFIKNDDQEYYLRELSRTTRVSPATTYRILNKIVNLGILEVREIKTAKLYKLGNNKIVDFLKSILEVDVIEYFVEAASKLEKVEEILLLGKKEKAKANVLILGNGINTAEMKLLTAEIKEKYDYTLNQMILSKEQYEQMSAMGLYPGSKRVLYKKV